MTIDNIKEVVDTFIKYLQLPESPYTLTMSESSDEVEMKISENDELLTAVTISYGTVSILYNGDYDEHKFFKRTYQSPIYLLYILSVVYYSTVGDKVKFSFNDLLTILIGEEITNWKELAVDLAKMVMLDAETNNDTVIIDGKELAYTDYTGKITYGSLEFDIEPYSYTDLIEAIFLIVEYVATVNDTQDSLFTDEATENLIEEETGIDMDGGFGGFGGDMDIDVDMDMPEGAVTPDDIGGDEGGEVIDESTDSGLDDIIGEE